MAGQRKSVAEVRALVKGAGISGRQGEQLVKIFEGLTADITALEAWGAALAAKLNADAGVTDVNYDTTPL